LKKLPPHGRESGEIKSPSTYPSTLGTRKADQGDRVGEIGGAEKEEEAVEELFGQLWVIPPCSPPRVTNPERVRGLPHGFVRSWLRRIVFARRTATL
jgi:hypothetical protein